MQKLIRAGLASLLFLAPMAAPILAPGVSNAADAANPAQEAVEKTVELAKENPGKAAGVAGCAAILIFPPAAIWCAASLIGGATYDGDTQKLVKEVIE